MHQLGCNIRTATPCTNSDETGQFQVPGWRLAASCTNPDNVWQHRKLCFKCTLFLAPNLSNFKKTCPHPLSCQKLSCPEHADLTYSMQICAKSAHCQNFIILRNNWAPISVQSKMNLINKIIKKDSINVFLQRLFHQVFTIYFCQRHCAWLMKIIHDVPQHTWFLSEEKSQKGMIIESLCHSSYNYFLWSWVTK